MDFACSHLKRGGLGVHQACREFSLGRWILKNSLASPNSGQKGKGSVAFCAVDVNEPNSQNPKMTLSTTLPTTAQCRNAFLR